MAGHVHVILDGDDALQDWIDEIPDHRGMSIQDAPEHYSQQDNEVRAVYLSKGMTSGKPACMIAARDKGERPVIIEMSVEMFLTVAAAFKGKYESEGFKWT